MYRTHNCGELRISDVGSQVKLSGWVQIARDFGGMTFIDLRDRYGITQLVFNMDDDAGLCERARKLGREFVISVTGQVRERSNKNPNRSTGDIEIEVKAMEVLNASKVPPFTIEDETDGGDDLRMKYRYLDLRRHPVQQNIIFRSKLAIETRKYLSGKDFLEIETPFLIKSTPEGARDFVVPSRMNQGQFYALPQSPQTFKQILMVAGMDKYFQIVKCFRDEDLRADRQPEFTQIDCEMAFVTQEEVLATFEGLTKYLFKTVSGIELPDSVAMSIAKRMRSNVRDLEGALNTLAAKANFLGRAIDDAFAQETLRDLMHAQQQAISAANIVRVVGDYYQLRVADLIGKRRTQSLARARQMAMALARELTEHSLPEIGNEFGGRDHTTVLHACRVIRGLVETDGKVREDWDKLIRKLSE